MLFPGEAEAIETVVQLAERYGYGRMIQIVQQAWRDKCIAEGQRAELADLISGIVCVWCNTDSRTGKKALASSASGRGKARRRMADKTTRRICDCCGEELGLGEGSPCAKCAQLPEVQAEIGGEGEGEGKTRDDFEKQIKVTLEQVTSLPDEALAICQHCGAEFENTEKLQAHLQRVEEKIAKLRQRAEAAEAEAARLRRALEQIATGKIVGEERNYKDTLYIVRQVAADALAKESEAMSENL